MNFGNLVASATRFKFLPGSCNTSSLSCSQPIDLHLRRLSPEIKPVISLATSRAAVSHSLAEKLQDYRGTIS